MEVSSRYEGRGNRAVAPSAPRSLSPSLPRRSSGRRSAQSRYSHPRRQRSGSLPAARCLRSRRRRRRMAEARGWGPAPRLPKPGTWTPRTPWGAKGARGGPPRWKPGEQNRADRGGRSGLRAALGREPRRCRPGVCAELPVPSCWVPVPFVRTPPLAGSAPA